LHVLVTGVCLIW